MTFRQRKLVAAMEDINGGAEAEVASVPETAVEVEAAASEIATGQTELEQMDVAVEEGEADIEALSDVQDVMQEAVDTGEGMSEQTAEMAEIAIESICARLGFQRTKRVMPSLESFGQKGSRLAATRIALEGVGDSIKTAVKSVIQWLKDMWEKFKGFMAGIFRSREAMEKHLAGLRKKAEALEASAKGKEQTIKFGGMTKISVGKEANLKTAETVMHDVQNLGAHAVDYLQIVSETMRAASADAAESVSAEAIGKVLGNAPEVKVEKGAKGVKYHGNLPGGIAFGAETVGEGEDATVRLVSAVAGEKPESAKALTKDEILTLLTAAEGSLTGLKTFEKVQKELEAVTKKSIEVMEAAVKFADASSKHDDAEAEKKALKASKATVKRVRTNVGNVSAFIRSLAGMNFTAVKASAEYASASISNIKGEDKKDDEGKK